MGQVIVDSLVRGSELALLAVGLTLVFGVLRFANIAQVEFATLGAYGMVLVASVAGVGILLQALIAIVAVGLLAVAVYRVVFVRLLRSSAAMAMIGSLALSILVRAVIQTVTGPDPKELDLPLERGVDIGGALVTPTQLRLVAISAVALAVLIAVLRLTPLGRSIRAVSANPELAAAAGINRKRITDVTWFIAGALGALAGVLLAMDTQVSLDMGFGLLLPVFAAALLGGLGSVGGAVAAAYLLALVENLVLKINFGSLVGGDGFVPVDYRAAVGFVMLVVVLLYRPQGLFGREARRA
ncbi:MAG: branched-chain amino acid ABC transporter permease [Thermoleophilaceae bacterium]|nr:branched-chain amino acid ABC transporter permease [Thermoleophilaceae bacterium]